MNPPADPDVVAAVMDLEGLAAFFKVSTGTAERLAATPGFPRIDLTPGPTRRKHIFRYIAADVIAWAKARNGNGHA